MTEYGEWLLTEVLKDVPHRQWVFSVPKRLRIYFLYDRKLLAKLSVCAWKVINTYLKSTVRYDNAVIENMLSWHHSGFNVYIGDRIESDDNPRSRVKPDLVIWQDISSVPG